MKNLSLKKSENGLYGVMDSNGEWKYAPQFKDGFEWENFIVVSIVEDGEEVWGWMDKEGEWMEEPWYGSMEDTGNGYLEAWWDGDGYRIYPDGKVLEDIEWEDEDWEDDEE